MINWNPFRYRGYYYDGAGTNLYYLQSRYYNPATGRFLNADGYVSTGQGLVGYNMYAYCNNNPVTYVDHTGQWVVSAIIFGGMIIGGLFVFTNSAHVDSEPQTSQTDLNLYDSSTGSKQDDKINVKFSPDGENPSFQIENSYRITDKDDRRAILEQIMKSEYYSQDVYGRTIDSMMIEWDAHNDIYWWTEHTRVAHVDFDKNSEEMKYWDYWWLGIRELFK